MISIPKVIPVGCALARNVACQHATYKIPGAQPSALNFQLLP